MILHEVTFGPVDRKNRQDAEIFVEYYLAALLHNGQVCGEYFIVVKKGSLTALLSLSGMKAKSLRYHCKYGKKRFKQIKEFFGKPPQWKLLEDVGPKRDTTWMGAPFLYLCTDHLTWESPLCRGDNGKPIPLYRLPGAHEDREAIYFWQDAYHAYDAIWMKCSALEIPVYKQLADPSSELSQQGLKICKAIEKVTGVPTYYYLTRYWGRRDNEDKRKCPGCGSAWRMANPSHRSSGFWHFAFQCKRCRLVSHLADSNDDERHAVIGEFHPKLPKSHRPH